MPWGMLEVTGGPAVGDRIELDGELMIGRSASGPGTLGNDHELSRRHAVIRREGGRAVIEDLGSSNGSFVNGRRITSPQPLTSGDELTLGSSSLRYVDPDATAGGAIVPAAARPPARPPTAREQPPVAAAALGAPTAPSYGRAATPARQRRTVPLAAMLAVLALGIAGVVAAVVIAGHRSSTVTTTIQSAATGGTSPGSNRCVKADNGRAGPGHFLFITSACENATSTVATFPLHRGISHGQTVWYVITDDSDKADAQARGVNYVPKLANALGTRAVQKVAVRNGVVDFPATVKFGQTRVLKPGPGGFPPAVAKPGAVGEPGYSPLIEMPDGTVLNAPQIANSSGRALKVINLDTTQMTVQYKETEGRYEDKHVHYASFDSSSPIAATLEVATYAPALAAVPSPDKEGLGDSARERLVALVNGPTGAGNPSRQGENSTVLDHLDPHNILHEVPTLPDHSDVGDIRYAPMWDVHLAAWTPAAIADGTRVEIRSTDEVNAFIARKVLTGPGGAPFKSSGFVVNCPLISIDLP